MSRPAVPPVPPAPGPNLPPDAGARDLPRDEHLRAALRHLPDVSLQPPPHLRAQLLAAAERAVAAAPAPGPAGPAARQPRWRGWRPLGLGASGAFASLMLAGVIGLIWREDLPGPAVDGPAVRPPASSVASVASTASTAPSPSPLPATTQRSKTAESAPAVAGASTPSLMGAAERGPILAAPRGKDAPAADHRLSPAPPASPPASPPAPAPSEAAAAPMPDPAANPQPADPLPEHPDVRRLQRQTPAQAAPSGESPVTAPPSPDPGLPTGAAAGSASPAAMPLSALTAPAGPATGVSAGAARARASDAANALAWRVDNGPPAGISPGWLQAAQALDLRLGQPSTLRELPQARQVSLLRPGLGGQLQAQIWLTPSLLLWCPATGEPCRLSPLDAAASQTLLRALPPAGAVQPSPAEPQPDGPAPAAAADQPPKRDSR